MLPALMVVLAAAMWAVQVVGVQLECVDATRAAARAAARGEPLERVREAAQAATRQGAQVNITRTQHLTKVEISLEIRPDWASGLPPVTVTASATAGTEQ